MIRRPPRTTRTATLFPYTTLFRADPIHQIIVDDELRAADVSRPSNPIGIGWAGPTILHGGSAEQKDRYLMPLLAGEEVWCQLFSEPGRSEEHTSELQSLMRISYAVLCLKKKT